MPRKSAESLLVTGAQAQQACSGGHVLALSQTAHAADGTASPQEEHEQLLTAGASSPEEALLPCSLNAAMASVSGGALGAVFGFGALPAAAPPPCARRRLRSDAARRCNHRRQSHTAQRAGAVGGCAYGGLHLSKGAQALAGPPAPRRAAADASAFRPSPAAPGLTCSAPQSFATFSGVFALASCLIQRLRNKHDGAAAGPARVLRPHGALHAPRPR